MKQLLFILFVLLPISVNAQERNYLLEAEQAFQRCEYFKAAELYRAAYVIKGIKTDVKRNSCIECAEAQRNAREQKSLGNNEAAGIWFNRILEINPKDTEALNFIKINVHSKEYTIKNIDTFPIIYSMHNTIECDGVYKGPDWEKEYQNHSKKFHKKLANKLNPKAFFVECSFKCPNAFSVDDYYENLVLLSFDTGHRRFSIFLTKTGHILINTNYGDYEYETRCEFSFSEWNDLQVSYNRGVVKVLCNNILDEFKVVMKEEGWTDHDISTTYWGTSNTYKGLIKDITVGSAPL